eukprot:3792238-Amphidinium_carterae.1
MACKVGIRIPPRKLDQVWSAATELPLGKQSTYLCAASYACTPSFSSSLVGGQSFSRWLMFVR